MQKSILISIVTYNNGEFDVMIEDDESHKSITLSGEQRVTDEEFEFINEIAPACVWTKWSREIK